MFVFSASKQVESRHWPAATVYCPWHHTRAHTATVSLVEFHNLLECSKSPHQKLLLVLISSRGLQLMHSARRCNKHLPESAGQNPSDGSADRMPQDQTKDHSERHYKASSSVDTLSSHEHRQYYSVTECNRTQSQALLPHCCQPFNSRFSVNCLNPTQVYVHPNAGAADKHAI